MGAKTARDIIEEALIEIRVLGIGQTVNSEVEQRAFKKLNNLLESLSLDDFKIVAWTEESETLTSGTARYTVGSGGDFDTNRPLEIWDDCYISDSSTDYPVRYLTQDVYRDASVKTSSGRPIFMTYTPEFPLGKMSFYPTPDAAETFNWRARIQLTQFATLATSVNFYPGFERFITLALAIEIAGQNGKSVGKELAATLVESRTLIERQNAEPIQPVQLDELSRLTGSNRVGSILTGPYS